MRKLSGISVCIVLTVFLTACTSSPEGSSDASRSNSSDTETTSSSAPSFEAAKGRQSLNEQATSSIDYWDERLVLPGRGDKGDDSANEALYQQMNAGVRSSLEMSEQVRLKSLAKEVLLSGSTKEGRAKFPELWEEGSEPDGPILEEVTVLASSAEVHRVAGEPYREVYIVFEGYGEGRFSRYPPVARTYCFRPAGTDWRPIKCEEVPTK